MSTTKEIELILSTKLKADDAVNDARGLGLGMASSIEKAFEGIGEKIGQKLVNDILKGVQASQLGSSGGGQGPQNVAIVDPYNRPYKTAPVATNIGADFGVPSGQPISKNRAVDDYLERKRQATLMDQAELPKAIQETQKRAAMMGERSTSTAPSPYKATGLKTSLGSAGSITDMLFGQGPLRQELNQEESARASYGDSVVGRVRAFKALKKINPDADSGDFFSQKQLATAQENNRAVGSAAATEITKLIDSIKDLRNEVNKNSSTYKDLSEKKNLTKEETVQLGKLEKQRIALNNNIERERDLQDTLENAGRDAETLNSVAAKPLGRKFTGKHIAAAGGAIAAGMGFMGELPFLNADRAVGQRARGGFDSRDMADGNIAGMIATAQLGGAAEADKQAASSAKWSIGAKIGGGLATAAGGVFAAPATMGAGFLAAGAGLGVAWSGVKDLWNFDKKVASNRASLQSKKVMENKEFQQAYGESSAQAQSAYSDAQGLGSSRMSKFLYGGGQGGILDQAQSSGLSKNEMLGSLRQYSSGMGGVFNNANFMDDERFQSEIAKNMSAQGQGFYNAASVSSAMYQGRSSYNTVDRAENFMGAASGARGMFNILSSQNFDQTIAPQLLDSMAQRGGSFGSMDTAQINTLAAAGYADKAGLTSASQVGYIDRMQSSITERMRTGSGIEGVAKNRALRNLEKKLGRDLTTDERINYLGNDLTEKTLMSDFGLDEGTAKTRLQEFVADNKEQLRYVNAKSKGVSMKVGDTFLAREGATNTSQTDEGVKFYEGGTNFATVRQERVDARDKAAPSVGQEEKTLTAKIDITKTVEGFNTLGQVMPILNDSFPAFVEKFREFADIMKGASPSQDQGAILRTKQPAQQSKPK